MPLRPGEALGRYVIDGVIGHGGMGSVYRARDTRLQRQVALKILTPVGEPPSALATPGASARILREARIAAKLEHPNIVSIYDVDEVSAGEHEGLAWIAMELVEGRSLRACVGDASIPVATRIRWLTEIARALSAAHRQGLVHRDVKPENVMVRIDGVAKVLDFGVAKQLPGLQALSPDRVAVTPDTAGDARLLVHTGAEPYAATVTREGGMSGTLYYMSPEQMKGEPVDPRSDQFSWAVVAYELLTGVHPWRNGAATVQVIAAVLGTDPPAPETRNADVPSWLSRLVLRALAKRADDRFASMDEVIGALEVNGEAARTNPSPLPARPQVVSSRPPVPVPAAGGRRLRLVGLRVGALAIGALAIGLLVLRASPSGRSRATSPGLPAPTAVACTSSVACARAAGAPALCIDGACRVIASRDCHVSADARALASDSTIWFGSLYPTTGPIAETGLTNERGTDLARQDFAEASAALAASGTDARPMALVACDEADDPARAARHLVEDLRVPAVLGFANGTALIDLASTVFIPEHVLALTTLTPSAQITRIPRPAGEPPLVWRAGYGLPEAALALAAFVEKFVEPELRAEGGKRTRVALVRTKAPGTLAFSEDLFAALRFNGRSALDNGDDFQEIILDAAAADPARESAAALGHLCALDPNVIVYTGASLVKPILEPFEKSCPGSRPRPRYVSNASIGETMGSAVGSDADLRRREFGITLPSATPINARFTLHYNGVFGTTFSREDAPSTSYDGFYLLAYAALALGSHPVSGPDLANAMARLVPPGAPVEIGPSGIFDAFEKLSAGASIDLSGAGGPLDLDVRTGENATDLAILCMEPGKYGGAATGKESGLVYSAKTGMLGGKMHCR